jgi:hypothetical protein
MVRVGKDENSTSTEHIAGTYCGTGHQSFAVNGKECNTKQN